ncbi:VOC family protein [Costertonia aggregata]|uniref:VOC family protein n=1 Tax=Costertonia aggregata TaxID=343403 RepID=A0A7H9ANL3_9FLAO|nr:VOC family protein [Costertonia aggregata]QLG45018.1 VOC family protein [Costertonia aggregata]
MRKAKINIPNGIGEGALTSYIHTATLCTVDLETYKHFYGKVMKMQIDAVILTDEEKNKHKAFWNVPEDIDFDLYHCYRATVPSLIQLRILHLKSPTPQIHKSYSSYELGTFSLGFPTSDAKAMDKRMQEYGVKAMAPMQLGDIVRANGDKGHYLETIYKGPDYLHCVGIERVNYPQLAPCDPADGFGGPGYSAFVAKDSDAEVAFYTDVLEHHILFDSVWEAAEDGALGVNPGTPFRFCGIYAPKAAQNHFLLLDFKDGNMIDTGVQSCIPNQGLGMYTFQTGDIEKVVRNAKSKGITIKSEIQEVSDYILGDGKACLLETPNGMYVEIFQAG